ncbi:MAG: DUF4403 family protein [Myxococcales bacterium]|nr:DUF4403 family protein [Myxococcales bacterium]
MHVLVDMPLLMIVMRFSLRMRMQRYPTMCVICSLLRFSITTVLTGIVGSGAEVREAAAFTEVTTLSLDVPITIDGGMVTAAIDRELPRQVDKEGWQSVGGGGVVSGLAYRLFLHRDALRVQPVSGGFDIEVDVTFDVDVRKQIDLWFAQPVLEGSTPDDRRATISVELRPTLDANATMKITAGVTEVKWHNPIDLYLKGMSVVRYNVESMLRDELMTYLNGQAEGLDREINRRMGVQVRVDEALKSLADRGLKIERLHLQSRPPSSSSAKWDLKVEASIGR